MNPANYEIAVSNPKQAAIKVDIFNKIRELQQLMKGLDPIVEVETLCDPILKSCGISKKTVIE